MSNAIEAMHDHTLYKDAHEKFVKRHVVYMEEQDSYAYLDPEYTKRVSCQELMNMALDGLVIHSTIENPHLVFPSWVEICRPDSGVEYCLVSGTNILGNAIGVYSEEYNPDDSPR